MSVTTSGETSGEVEEPKTAEVPAEALDPLVGQTLDGRFRIVDVIGKGAMGKVYRAVQLPLNRAVALKVLDSRYGAGREESFKQRFLVEAALTSKLNHPNTVRVLDYGSTRDGLFFLAMEYLDGETLEHVLRRGPLPWHRVVAIAQQIGRALREAHELGVVHRDLKPGNVVLLAADDDADFVKVLDFGLVKSFVEGHELEGRAITQQGMLMGSPPYMAPEQGEKNRADPRSDIYSLGTMLFEMLSGKPPFTGGAPLEIILKHVHQPVPKLVAPKHFEPVPEALEAIVLKCLAKSPMDRFQSMDELLLALQDLGAPSRPAPPDVARTEAAVPVVAPPPEVAPPTARPSSLLVATFALASLVGILGTWLVVRPGVPQTLEVHVESTPPGAQVTLDGEVLGVTPLDVERPLKATTGQLDFTLRLDGYVPARLALTATGARFALHQALVPLPSLIPPQPEAATPPAVAPPPAPVSAEPETSPAPAPQPEARKAEPTPKPPARPLRPERKQKALAPTGARPASKLDDDDDGAAPASATSPVNELKRPDTR
jgi:tRNA A-37 threonylcarbamoyl transferase component Bud32